MYLGGDGFTLGCSAIQWTGYIWEAKARLWATIPQNGMDVLNPYYGSTAFLIRHMADDRTYTFLCHILMCLLVKQLNLTKIPSFNS
jgi:hypothetical protein